MSNNNNLGSTEPVIKIFKDEEDEKENFLKDFLKDIYRKIIETKDFKIFEKFSIAWIKYKIEINDKDTKDILQVMQNHKESNNWFTSIMGFFYQHGIGCIMDRNISLKFYLLAINNEIEKDITLNLNKDFNKL